MKLPLFLITGVALLSASCRRQPPDPVPSPSLPPPLVQPAQLTPPPPKVVTLDHLTQALQTYLQVKPDFPKDLKELADMKLIPHLPPPPPGKKYEIDRPNIRVVVVNQ